MEKRHQVRIKTLWSGRYKKEERSIKHCTIEQRTSIEKEMENKAKDKATPVWIIRQRHAFLQLRYLGIITKWQEETEVSIKNRRVE